MNEFLLEYHPVPPTTWAYLSSLLMIGLFFKFGRFWSVRNLDLVLLILFAPGLLLVHYGRDAQETVAEEAAAAAVEKPLSSDGAAAADSAAPSFAAGDRAPGAEGSLAVGGQADQEGASSSASAPTGETTAAAPPYQSPPYQSPAQTWAFLQGRQIEFLGFVWLLAVCALFLVRLLLDPTMVRRPLLEPNLSTGGLAFIGCSLFVFLMANVVNSQPTADDLEGPRSVEMLLTRGASQAAGREAADAFQRHGPGNALLHVVPSLTTMPWFRTEKPETREIRYVRTAKMTAILSHLAVVIGIVGIGYRHFENIKAGIGGAAMYLMLPYAALMTGRVDHVLPAALLVWAVLWYRHPLPAGMFVGLAVGVIYYPLFLVPLWVSFYWQRGLMRFTVGMLSMVAVMACSLIFVSNGPADFLAKLREMLGLWKPLMGELQGVWGAGGWDPFYRIPVLTAFLAMCVTLAVWPAQKNLGTLLSCSAAVMVGVQFWHGYGGGLYMAWYLPLIVLTIFRPNLEDRVALSVLGEGWFPGRRRRAGLAAIDRAA